MQMLVIALLSVALLAPRGDLVLVGAPGPRQETEDVWPRRWISDVPVVDLSGVWRFVPERSDPMIEAWRGREISYRIEQQPTHIVLEFRVEGGASNTQTYRWDGTVRRFERGGTQVEEMARWTAAGRVLETEGRWWYPDAPDEVRAYGFRYEARGDVLTFQQTNDTGVTVWRFVRVRG